MLLASYSFALSLQVVQNKILHPEAWHKFMDLKEVLNLNSFYVPYFAATFG